MIITIPWLKEHLETKASQTDLIKKINRYRFRGRGNKREFWRAGEFRIAKIIKSEKHPNADKLKVCDVNIGGKKL